MRRRWYVVLLVLLGLTLWLVFVLTDETQRTTIENLNTAPQCAEWIQLPDGTYEKLPGPCLVNENELLAVTP